MRKRIRRAFGLDGVEGLKGEIIMAVPDKKELDRMLDRAWDTNERGYPLDAIELYNKVLEIDPNYAKVYSWRAGAYISLKDYEQAIDDCNKCIELKPRYSEVYNNRGCAYYDLGQYEQAIQDYSKAIERRKNNHKAYSNRGWAYFELGDYEKARQDCNKALEIQSNYAEAIKLLKELQKKQLGYKA